MGEKILKNQPKTLTIIIKHAVCIQTSGWIYPETFKVFYLIVKVKVLGNTNTLKDDLLKAVTYIKQ